MICFKVTVSALECVLTRNFSILYKFHSVFIKVNYTGLVIKLKLNVNQYAVNLQPITANASGEDSPYHTKIKYAG